MGMTARQHFSTSRRLRRLRQVAASVLFAGFVSACSGAGDLLEGLTGSSEAPLAGQREAVLQNSALSSGAVAEDPVAIPAAVTNPNWSQPGGAPNNTMHNLTLSRELKRAWAVQAGVGSDNDGRLTASPIVVGGRIFVLDSQATVRALSTQNGGTIWTRPLAPEGKDGEGAFGGGLASDGSRIYATSAFGEVLCIDINSGAVVWRSKFGQPIRSAPTVSNGKLYFSNVANDVYAISTADGSEIWRYQGTGQQASIIASNSPAVSGNYVTIPYTTGDLLTFETGSGYLAWSDNLVGRSVANTASTINDIAGRPVITDGAVYAIAHSGRLASFNLPSGEERWSVEISGTQTPWIAGDYVFVIAGQRTLAAIARSNGGVRWSTNLPDGGVWAGPVVGGGRLLAISSKGVLASVSPQTGELINKVGVGEEFFIAPVIANGTVFLLADDGTLIAMR
jgi:outer membrane protein assembly factor BamB